MIPFTEDISAFYATLYGGIIIGFLFDTYIVFKSNFKFMKSLTHVLDIIFWIVATIVTFITVNAVESFDIRYYHFIALFIGFIMYKLTLSKFVIKITNKLMKYIINLCISIVKTTVSIINNLYYIIIYSIHFLFDIIFYIPTIMMFKKNKKKV